MFIQFIILIFGFVLLISGANFLIKGSSGIAKKFNISEIVIGLTIVSLGTSLPELVVTIISSITKNNDIVVGNVIGSNICNLLLILGIISIIKPIKFEKSTISQNLPLLIFVNILILIMSIGIFSIRKLVITKFNGYILLLIASLYFIYPIINYVKENNKSKVSNNINNNSNNNFIQYLIYILIGGFSLRYGGDFVVDSSTNLAYIFDIPERIISLTIVALGTSLPELVTSVVALLKGDEDLAEGNIIGSCIINFCLILGLGSVIYELSLSTEYIENLILLLASSILIWLYAFGNKNHMITRSNGVILIIIYIIYNVSLFL